MLCQPEKGGVSNVESTGEDFSNEIIFEQGFGGWRGRNSLDWT